MIVLGIESTCDETGVSIVQDGKIILSNVLASSADIHAKYGGVFPELACRRHIETIIPLIDEALKQANTTPEEIDLIAVAKGPGLIGALLIGMNVAKGLSIAWNKPLIGINHVEAHLYASMMDAEEVPLPALGIVISGGHTLLLKVNALGEYETLATTVDDAIGEAFDKVASLLDLPYPGGPQIEKLALKGNPKTVSLSAGKVKRSPLDFSFSGLKTAVLYAKKSPEGYLREDLAASFQQTALGDVVKKSLIASQKFDCKALIFGGGVSANQKLREMTQKAFPKMPIFWPRPFLAVDNAVMIAALGCKKFKGISDSLELEPQTRMNLS